MTTYNFNTEEVAEYFMRRTVNPGRKHIFRATIAQSLYEKKIRRCSYMHEYLNEKKYTLSWPMIHANY